MWQITATFYFRLRCEIRRRRKRRTGAIFPTPVTTANHQRGLQSRDPETFIHADALRSCWSMFVAPHWQTHLVIRATASVIVASIMTFFRARAGLKRLIWPGNQQKAPFYEQWSSSNISTTQKITHLWSHLRSSHKFPCRTTSIKSQHDTFEAFL